MNFARISYLVQLFMLIMLLLACIAPQASATSNPVTVSETTIDTTPTNLTQIESWIQEQMKHAEIQGLSVTIIRDGQTILQKGYGFANTATNQSVDNTTGFEIGSNSKAFTGLAVLELIQQKKIKMNDPVNMYLPWFKPTYEAQPAIITIEQLLHHTSGIPFATIGNLPEGSGPDKLEQTVRLIEHQRLANKPGETFEYATINYDVLGLIIEKVSNQSYADYMKKNIFTPLGMNNTFVKQGSLAEPSHIASGYKISYTSPRVYNPPAYDGNAPAGYIVSTAEDMTHWLAIQLGNDQQSLVNNKLIQQSHTPNRSVSPDSNGSSYAIGWDIFQKGQGEISHAGNNPTFSSFIVMRPAEKVGVLVMANLNSDYTQLIGQGILDQLQQKEAPFIQSDTYKKADQIAVGLIIAVAVIALVLLFYVFRTVHDIWLKVRKPVFHNRKSYMLLGVHVLAAFILGIALYKAPDILLYGLTWNFIKVWLPASVMMTVYLLLAVGVLYLVYSLLVLFFPKGKEKSLLAPIMLGVVSGLGNAFVIFIINESFNRTNNLFNGLLFYFGIAIILYVFGQRVIRAMLVKLTNQIIFEKRTELVHKLLRTPFSKLDSFERGRVEATLNNDTEVISRSLSILISGATNIITLVCCFLYLGIMNLYSLLLSIVIMAVLAIVYMIVGNRANRLMEETRDLQNTFFRFIDDLLAGFKELSLNKRKSNEFENAMKQSSQAYKDKRNVYQLRYSDIFVLGELLFVLVIGVVVFVFPEIFKQMDSSMLRNYVFVFLYMTGPVNQLLDSIPHYAQIKISWERLQTMLREIEQKEKPLSAEVITYKQPLQLQLQDIMYSYKSHNEGDFTDKPTIDQKSFNVGPISSQFESGSIIFITGGNGSGKSTLARLLTGLYEPDSGQLLLNNEVISPEELGQHYSAIFGDFHLFDRLYGIDWAKKQTEIQHYLQLLKLEGKVTIHEGIFSTVKLSTGQKKRLALLVAYLEDRPFCLLDEWAADQDPQYRSFFYHTLLPDMKAQGKCVIAITHDDRYFDIADHVIKMDSGRIVSFDSTIESVTM